MPTRTTRGPFDRKAFAPAIGGLTTTAGANSFTIASVLPDSLAILINGAANATVLDAITDSFVPLPSPTLATFAAGACGVFHPMGPTGTAVAGSTSTTLTTATTILTNLRPGTDSRKFRVRLTGGTGAGQERGIASHTTGPNSMITVDTAWTTTPDATSAYVLITGRYYVYGGGVTAAGSFKFWDHATQTWSGNLVVTSLPTFTAEGVMAATPSVLGTLGLTVGSGITANTTSGFASGTATSGAATTLTNTAKTWTANQWTNSQVRIYSGTGAGQVRTVASNTATVLTVSAVWTTSLDATSVYVIEGNDDFIYLFGNAAVTTYRYSISANAWSPLGPATARGGAPSPGTSASWVHGCDGTDWIAESTIRNGQRIYCFRGGSSTALDYYDVAANTWVSAVTYGKSGMTLALNISGAVVYDTQNYLYVCVVTSGQAMPVHRLSLRDSTAEAWSALPIVTSSAVGSRAWIVTYNDNIGTPVRWLYFILPGTSTIYRCMDL